MTEVLSAAATLVVRAARSGGMALAASGGATARRASSTGPAYNAARSLASGASTRASAATSSRKVSTAEAPPPASTAGPPALSRHLRPALFVETAHPEETNLTCAAERRVPMNPVSGRSIHYRPIAPFYCGQPASMRSSSRCTLIFSQVHTQTHTHTHKQTHTPFFANISGGSCIWASWVLQDAHLKYSQQLCSTLSSSEVLRRAMTAGEEAAWTARAPATPNTHLCLEVCCAKQMYMEGHAYVLNVLCKAHVRGGIPLIPRCTYGAPDKQMSTTIATVYKKS